MSNKKKRREVRTSLEISNYFEVSYSTITCPFFLVQLIVFWGEIECVRIEMFFLTKNASIFYVIEKNYSSKAIK